MKDENKTIIGLKSKSINYILNSFYDENKTIIGLKYFYWDWWCGSVMMKIRL